MLLAIHSWPGGTDAVFRHSLHFKNAEADQIIVVNPVGRSCSTPPDFGEVLIGDGKYMEGDNLVRRLIETFEWFLTTKHDQFLLAEYDVLIRRPLPKPDGIAGHIAGGRTFNARSSYFTHNPWAVSRACLNTLLPVMQELLATGLVTYGSCESSPDIFISWACETAGIPMRTLWTEFSRNCFDLPGDLDRARDAWRNGVDVIHGCKTQREFDYILT